MGVEDEAERGTVVVVAVVKKVIMWVLVDLGCRARSFH